MTARLIVYFLILEIRIKAAGMCFWGIVVWKQHGYSYNICRECKAKGPMKPLQRLFLNANQTPTSIWPKTSRH
jgi:hypothetical protein